MENMERYANGTENLRFDKEDYFHDFSFLYQLFYKRNRKHRYCPLKLIIINKIRNGGSEQMRK